LSAKRKPRNLHLWAIALGLTLCLALVDLVGGVELPWFVILAPLLVVTAAFVLTLAVFGLLVLLAIGAQQNRKK
jgi:membrane protein YdbS with pleckstrin-like domain